MGWLCVATAALLLATGATLAIGRSDRYGAGFLMSPNQTIQTSSYAIATEPVTIHPAGSGRLTAAAVLGDMRVTVTSVDDRPLFLGLASATDVRALLAGVDHTTLTDFDGRQPVYREDPGGPVRTLPSEADIWAVSTQGVGSQSLTWTPQPGDWMVVVLDANGRAGITADASIGAEVPSFGYLLGIVFVTGYAALIVGAALLLAASAPRKR